MSVKPKKVLGTAKPVPEGLTPILDVLASKELEEVEAILVEEGYLEPMEKNKK